MLLPPSEILARLGAGNSIAAVCLATSISREEFDHWWHREIAARLPKYSGTRIADVTDSVRIARDEWGIPHIFAENDDDLFFGFGYATAQDRLFQLDYLRRRALGRLSEILGPEGLELDLIARTIGLGLIADQEWKSLPEDTRRLVVAFTNGINALIQESVRAFYTGWYKELVTALPLMVNGQVSVDFSRNGLGIELLPGTDTRADAIVRRTA